MRPRLRRRLPLGASEVHVHVAAALGEHHAPGLAQREQRGALVGGELAKSSLIALVLGIIGILIFVTFRFELSFAVGAIVALLHDVLMTVGVFALLGRELTLTMVGAVLMIAGYSINDTIVVYDRIREEMVRYKGKPLPEIINIAVNDTLSRTILTSGVTALSLIGLLIFGVGEIWDFAMAMLIGIIVGTYSSVYIASPLTIWLDQRAAAKERASRGGMKAKVA